MKIFMIIACSLSVLAVGCSKPQPSDLPASNSSKSDSSKSESRKPDSAKSDPGKSDSAALQGTWIEQEETVGDDAKPTSLVIEGSNLEFQFHNEETNEIIKATFSLHEDKNPKQLTGVITASPDPEDIGKKFNAIYKIEDGTLTITANDPGEPAMPTAFDAPDMDKLIYRKK
jgi:uncharacterized protein (TIGR03067 family)